MDLLTHPAVAHSFDQRIAWNGSAVLGCDAPGEKHHEICSRLAWLGGQGTYRTAWRVDRRRCRSGSRSRGLLRRRDRHQEPHCES